MNGYICFIHRPGRPTPDLTVIACERHQVDEKVRQLARHWPVFSHAEVFDGDQPVMTLDGAGAKVIPLADSGRNPAGDSGSLPAA